MARAFVMVAIDAGHAEEVRASVLEFEGVSEAHIVAGEYDLVVEVERPAASDLMSTVASDLRSTSAVADTRTYVCLE
jgi:DNA-binding Lrp family transcriptional regulator